MDGRPVSPERIGRYRVQVQEERVESFREKAASGVFWISISSGGQQLANFLISIFLARLLLPEDFGPIAIVTGLIAILQVFSDMGVSVPLVQRRQISPSVIDSAFAATVVTSTLVFAAILGIADRLAVFFESPELSQLLKIASLWYLFRGMFSLCNCLLLRSMRYREISLLNLINIVVFGIASIIMAFQGLGARSIVWGQAVASAVLLGLGVWRAGYIPRSLGRVTEMRELLGFGLWVSGGRTIGSMSSYVDCFIVGKALSVGVLGSYYVAQKLLMVVPGTIRTVLDQVMFPIFSKWQNDPKRMEEAYWETFSYSVLLSLPPVCLLCLLADLVVPILLGGKWAGAIPLLKIMSVYAFARSFTGVFGSVIYATHRPQAAVLDNLVATLLVPVGVIIGSRWGLRGVAWGFAVSGILSTAFGQFLLKRFLGFSMGRLLDEARIPLLANLSASVPVFLLLEILPKNSLYQDLAAIMVAGAAWLLIYVFLLRLFLPGKLKKMQELFRLWPLSWKKGVLLRGQGG